MLNAAVVYNEAYNKGLMPDLDIGITEYSDEFRVLPKTSAEPGKWRTSRVPYMKEIMDCLSPSSPVQQIKAMKGTQLAFTEVGNNWICHTVDIAPCPMAMTLPTCDSAKDHAVQKLNPTIKNMPSLREKVLKVTSREAGSTTTYKEFMGGFIALGGANSGTSFRHKSIKNYFMDDIDGWPLDVDGEGDPVGLAMNRTDAFGSRKKIYKVSTPTVKGVSRIEQEYEDSDQREYYVPCPHCNYMQTLKWSNIKFDYKRKTYTLKGDVEYVCDECGALIEEYHKTWMLENGEWRAHNEGHEYRGYKLSSLYSPLGWLSWNDIVKEFLKCKKTNDPTLWQRWTNTRLAEVYEEKSLTLSHDVLFNRREEYKAEVPMGAAVLTCGVDVQDNRIELEVVGWGKGEESWGIEYKIFMGDPAKDEIWSDIDKFLVKTYLHEIGTNLTIQATCFDTGGHHTSKVYDFVRPRQGRRIYAIKGSSQPGKPIVGNRPSLKNKGKVPLYFVGTDTVKYQIYARIRIEEPGPGYMHFPMAYDEAYFRGLVSERVKTKHVKGFPQREWILPSGARNEPLDNRGYATAALEILKTYRNFNLDKLVDDLVIYERTKTMPPPVNKRRVRSNGIQI